MVAEIQTIDQLPTPTRLQPTRSLRRAQKEVTRQPTPIPNMRGPGRKQKPIPITIPMRLPLG